MSDVMKLRDLFVSDVTRDIPPVVHFHEQDPAKVALEVSEYIITGGWPDGHPNQRRMAAGIHEQYVALLRNIVAELDRPGGPDLPTVWISGFYGSGKSSFAKLLGLALDGMALPDGGSLAEAWLRQNRSEKAREMRDAWDALRQKVEPIAVVFDIGSIARDHEHIHAAAVRQVQRRLGYCSTDALVADFELRMERDGDWPRFEACARKELGVPWADVKDRSLAVEDFSRVMARMYPERYLDPMSWLVSRGGTPVHADAPEAAAVALRDMLRFRSPRSTLFLVIDEVSQYLVAHRDRVDRFRAFATELGSTLRGQAWLLALGQQKLDEGADESFLVWARDRFPPRMRVHLAATNIQDVVHRRLLQKRPEAAVEIRTRFERHRADLKLHAYGCEEATPEEFVGVYPMVPGQIDLILRLTSALRTRSRRAQGDDQAIRGLLQLLGELFRDRKLADQPVGTLVTLDQIYDVQHTALDADVQVSMARILHHTRDDSGGLMLRAAKAVAMLELIQDERPTDARLVAQCLCDRIDRGNQVAGVTEALEALRRANLLSYSDKHGYRLQSSAGEAWERERRDIGASQETLSEVVQAGLKSLLDGPERPRLQGRPFPWAGHYSDGRRADDVRLRDVRDEAPARVDFRCLARDERTESAWVRRSAETALRDRLVWVCGDTDELMEAARELERSRRMVERYRPRRESLDAARQILLQQEEHRREDLESKAREAVAACWMKGRMYFRGQPLVPLEQGGSFSTALHAAMNRALPNVFPFFLPTQIQQSDLMQLVEHELSGPSPFFLPEHLGILEMDTGRYVASCSGEVPRGIAEYIEAEGGLTGAALLSHFGGPPYGYTAGVVKACVAGLLRGSRVKLRPERGTEITAIRDAGVRELFERDSAFRRASIFPAGEDDIGAQARARICRVFQEHLGAHLDREDHVIADAVVQYFPCLVSRLRGVQTQLNRLPGSPEGPAVFGRLGQALEECIRASRQTRLTVRLVKKHLDTLRDGMDLLQRYESELTESAIQAVVSASEALTLRVHQLHEIGVQATDIDDAAVRLATHLARERPWQDIGDVGEDVAAVARCYLAERTRLLQWQEREVEAARARVRAREGFSTLTGEQSHDVLRPLVASTTTTSAEAIAPSLSALRDPFTLALQRAEEQANQTLDALLSAGEKPLIARLDLGLRHREVVSEADVEALVNEVRERLLEHVRAGVRVRVV
jgi:hypothetical protein